MANHTFIGLFDDRDAAQNAVGDLVGAGIDRDKISVVANDASGATQTSVVDTDGNLAAEGASAGLSSGAVVGGVAGLLIGAGFTFLPIAGLLLAGPIAGLIAGAATGAAAGGIVGGLIGLGIPQENAELYAEGIRRGGTLVTVQADSSMDSQVRNILDRDGAVDIDNRGASWKTNGYTGYDANAKPFSDAEIADERTRYGTSAINSDWNDTTNAPAPSNDTTYATGSTYGTDARNDVNVTPTSVSPTNTSATNTSARVRSFASDAPENDFTPATGFSNDGLDIDEDSDRSYRAHFSQNNPTGSYEEYAPAYQYGRRLASTGIGDWDSSETTYRTDWESRNPGTWDKVKDSVRHAYDSAKNAVTGGSDNNRATLR